MAEDNGTDRKKRVRLSDVWLEARELVWRYRKGLALGLVLMVVSRLAGFVLPLSSKYLIDDVLTGGNVGLLIPLALGVAAATFVQAATGFALAQVVSIAGQRAIAEMRRSVQAHVLRLPVQYYDSTKSGVLISRIMTDAEGIRNLVGTGLVNLTGGLLTASIALGLLLALNWTITLGTVALLLLFGGVMAYAFRRLRPIFRERGKLNAEVTGRLGEALGGTRVVKAYVAEKREERVFTKGVHGLFRNIASTITGTSAVAAVSTIIVGAAGVLIMVAGGRAVLNGTMTQGDLISYVFLVGLMVAPLVQIAGIGTQITEAFAGLDRIRELRQVATEQDDPGREPLDDVDGEVIFDNVTFEYKPGVPVLRNVSFHSPAGSTTALVGPSGAGKSTLIGLIMAFHSPLEGRVVLDGRSLDTVRLPDYRRHLGVVLQDNFLFDGTIRENIAFSRPGASDEEIREAARIAHCDEFVERFDDKYDTIVGERGVKLSGGQRQRVAIARAILADPRILILDEATSSLDSESEALIRDGLNSLRRGRTTFVIAHRLSTIKSADQILVLEEGRVVERGSHLELATAGGLYQRLYEKQAGFEFDQFINRGEDPVPEPAGGSEGSRPTYRSTRNL